MADPASGGDPIPVHTADVEHEYYDRLHAALEALAALARVLSDDMYARSSGEGLRMIQMLHDMEMVIYAHRVRVMPQPKARPRRTG